MHYIVNVLSLESGPRVELSHGADRTTRRFSIGKEG